MPSYESSINKDKTSRKLLQKLETRLRTPFCIDMESELSFISDLIFDLQSERSTDLRAYTKEALEIRSNMMLNKEFMSRRKLAKLLAGLLSPAAKIGVLEAIENFRKMPMFKSEMEKPANFNTRQDSNMLLQKERKPNFAVNYLGIKKFYVKALSQSEAKKAKPEPKTENKRQNFKTRGQFRGRGKFRPYYNNRAQFNNFQNQNFGYPGYGFPNPRFQGFNPNFNPNFQNPNNNQSRQISPQRLTDMRNKACFDCHQTGHAARNCLLKNSQNSQSNNKK